MELVAGYHAAIAYAEISRAHVVMSQYPKMKSTKVQTLGADLAIEYLA